MLKKINRKILWRKGERGVALIVVLSVLVLISLLAASAITVSQFNDRLTALERDRAQAAYAAESAAARAIWLLRHDLSEHPNREMGKGNPGDDSQGVRFKADGSHHKMELSGCLVKLQIFDMVSGKDISGPSPERNLQRSQDDPAFSDNPGKFERYQNFINALGDYVDGNDNRRENGGFERDDYMADRRFPLPRNAPLEYREELLWVNGAREFFQEGDDGTLGSAMIISASPQMAKPSGQQNLFSVSRESLLQDGFSEQDADRIISARNDWNEGSAALSDSLDPETIGRLEGKYSFRESGFYTIIVKAEKQPDGVERVLSCSIQISSRLGGGDVLRYYEWLFLQ